ncbi:MAG: Rpp14/Pop5 family protein [Candidatus Diapherotrites archaeon]
MKNVKKGIKPIPPTMRGKKRYINFELIGGEKLGENEVSKAVWDVFLKLYGEVGVARQKIWMIEFKKGNGILRCSNETTEEVKAGLLFLKKVASTAVNPKITLVSGSLRKLRKK